jgi:hypothetical protein
MGFIFYQIKKTSCIIRFNTPSVEAALFASLIKSSYCIDMMASKQTFARLGDVQANNKFPIIVSARRAWSRKLSGVKVAPE